MSDTWKPDFTKSNPYEGVPDSYLQKIYGTQAYDTALNKGWIQPYQPAKQQEQTTTTTSREAQADTWKPDFTKSNPYEGVPDSYLQKIYGTNAYNVAVNKGWIKPLYEPGIYGPIYYPAKVEPTKSEIIRREKSETIRQQQQRDLKQISEVPTTSEKVTPTIPFERKYYEAIDFGNTTGRNIYRALTPWAEEKGETVKSYIEAIPDMYTGKYDTQERLKERYEAEQKNKLWTRILLGGDTVKYDEKTGKYIGVVAGEAPLITTASKAANIPINITKIRNIASQYKMNPSWFAGIQNRIPGVLNIPKNILSQTGKIKGAATGEIRGLGQIRGISGKIRGTGQVIGLEKSVIENLPDNIKLVLIPQLYINPTQTSKETVKIIETLKPEEAIQQLRDTELLSTITISNPEIITKFITEIEPITQKEIITDIEEMIQNATELEDITKEQHKRITELINKIRERAKEQTETETATKEQERTQTQTETQTKTKTKTEVKTETPTKKGPKTPDDKLKGFGGHEDIAGKTEIKIRPLSPEYQEKARKIVKESDGAIAWRMGEVGKRDRWDVVVNPYTSNEQYYMILGKQPEGATIVKRGEGSAYGTTQVIRGQAPRRTVSVDSGFVDITITPTGKRSVKMRVTPDPKMETKGDITIGNSKPRISRRMGRISPKMPKLR